MPTAKSVTKSESGRQGKKRKASYSDLTLDDLKRMFKIKADVQPLFSRTDPVSPNAWLLGALEIGQKNALISEKARAEFIVTPILLFAQTLSDRRISLYSGVRLDVDPERGLKGVCDFVFSESPPLPILQAPLMVFVEAKKNDIEEGIGQCAAEMVAAQIFNANAGNKVPCIYGCVMTGTEWQFLRLTGTDLLIDGDQYYLRDLEKILGIFKSTLSSGKSKPKKRRPQ